MAFMWQMHSPLEKNLSQRSLIAVKLVFKKIKKNSESRFIAETERSVRTGPNPAWPSEVTEIKLKIVA